MGFSHAAAAQEIKVKNIAEPTLGLLVQFKVQIIIIIITILMGIGRGKGME